MNESASFIGIDVSKRTLDLYVLPQALSLQFGNDEPGHDAIISLLRSFPVQLVVMEATGGYEAPLACALQAAGFRIERYEDWSDHIAPHFTAVSRRVDEQRSALAATIDVRTIQHNYNIWRYWAQAGREGKIGWGYFVAVKDA